MKNLEELVKKNGRYFEKGSTIPFTRNVNGKA